MQINLSRYVIQEQGITWGPSAVLKVESVFQSHIPVIQFSCNTTILLPVAKKWRHIHQMFFFNSYWGWWNVLDWEQHSVVFSTHMKTINKKCGLIHFPTSDLVLWILPHCDRWGFHQSESSLPLDHPPDSTWLTPHTTRIPTAYHRNIKKLCWGWGHMDDFPLTHIFHSSLPCCSGSRKIHRELQLSNPCTTHMPSGPTAV